MTGLKLEKLRNGDYGIFIDTSILARAKVDINQLYRISENGRVMVGVLETHTIWLKEQAEKVAGAVHEYDVATLSERQVHPWIYVNGYDFCSVCGAQKGTGMARSTCEQNLDHRERLFGKLKSKPIIAPIIPIAEQREAKKNKKLNPDGK